MAHCEEGPDADVSTLELDGPVVGGEVSANVVEERKIPSKLGMVLAVSPPSYVTVQDVEGARRRTLL